MLNVFESNNRGIKCTSMKMNGKKWKRRLVMKSFVITKTYNCFQIQIRIVEKTTSNAEQTLADLLKGSLVVSAASQLGVIAVNHACEFH